MCDTMYEVCVGMTGFGHNYRDFGDTQGLVYNTIPNVWQQQSYTFTIGDNWGREDGGPEQAILYMYGGSAEGGNPSDITWYDRISVTFQDNGAFSPDVDVRTEKALNNDTYDYVKPTPVNYYDPNLQNMEYEDTMAPHEVKFLFYPREYSLDPFVTRPRIENYSEYGTYYITQIDWGDGNTEFDTDTKKLNKNEYISHSYQESGIYEVTGIMFNVTEIDGEVKGVANSVYFTARILININDGTENEFEYLGGDGYTFIPYKGETPIIGGVSKNSIYYKSLYRNIGYVNDPTEGNTPPPPQDYSFKQYFDKIKSQMAFNNITGISGPELDAFTSEYTDGSGVIWTGDQYRTGDVLPENLGQTDIGQFRCFTGPKQMYEILGFDETDTAVGTPGNERYYGNIVSSNYDPVADRNMNNGEQTWNDGSYYPVLPKFDEKGKVLDELQGNRIPFGSPGRAWNEDDELAIITNDDIQDNSLLIHIKMEFSEQNVLEDNSGNQNIAITTTDFEVNYDENFKPEKNEFIKNINISSKDSSH